MRTPGLFFEALERLSYTAMLINMDTKFRLVQRRSRFAFLLYDDGSCVHGRDNFMNGYTEIRFVLERSLNTTKPRICRQKTWVHVKDSSRPVFDELFWA